MKNGNMKKFKNIWKKLKNDGTVKHTVGGKNIAGPKPQEFIGFLIIMFKRYMNFYRFGA